MSPTPSPVFSARLVDLRNMLVKLAIAATLAVAIAGWCAIRAQAGTDTWCNPCNLGAGDARNSPYDHHWTLIYVHSLTSGNDWLGAGVLGYAGEAHGFGVTTHSYSPSSPLLYAFGHNANDPDWTASNINIHGDF
jgi:hypothetical protein